MNERKTYAKRVLSALKKAVPDAEMALNYSNNWELLVAVVLSAQCTDKQVNVVTEKLFKKYKTLNDYLNATQEEFEQDIYSTGFYRNKAKNILASAKIIKEQFGGEIPKTMQEMLILHGVSRKTANVVLGNAYGVVEGIAVDTHVIRLAQRLGLTKEKTPEKIERDLMEILPKKEWFKFTYYMIEYGRRYCSAKKHDHDKCPLKSFDI
ncbi:endonuclease III [Patescibacteria group bacterium]